MTTVHISENNWRKINSLKEPGETVDDVVTRLLQLAGLAEPNVSLDIEFEDLLDKVMEVENDKSSLTQDQIIEQSRSGWKVE